MTPLALAAAALLAVTALPYLAFLALYAWVRPSGVPVEKDRSAEPTVSVVLPTYDEADIVESKLEDVVELDYPMEKVEVVVVDSSDDATPDIVESFFAEREHPDLTLVREDEREGAAAALNGGVAVASNDVVLRTDADSQLAPDALRVAVASLSADGVGAITGRQASVIGSSRVEAEYRDALSHIQSLESHLDSTFVFHGPCGAFLREAFQPVDVDSLADDSEAAMRIRKEGFRVLMDPAMRFSETGVSGFRERRQRKDRRAVGLVRLLWRNRDVLGRYGRYGRVVLPFNWWFMIVTPWLVPANGLFMTAAAVALFGPAGLGIPVAVVAVGYLGQRDALGPLQGLWALADSQVSLLVAQGRLLLGEEDGTWTVDRDSREALK